MNTTFTLVDLVSQAGAVERQLRGMATSEKLAWLEARGTLSSIPMRANGFPQSYGFESLLGLKCVFFFDGDTIVFWGDNTTFTVED